MLADVQSSHRLARPFEGVGNSETEHQRTIVRKVCVVVQTGRLVVVSGPVGSSKTHLLCRIAHELAKAGYKGWPPQDRETGSPAHTAVRTPTSYSAIGMSPFSAI